MFKGGCNNVKFCVDFSFPIASQLIVANNKRNAPAKPLRLFEKQVEAEIGGYSFLCTIRSLL